MELDNRKGEPGGIESGPAQSVEVVDQAAIFGHEATETLGLEGEPIVGHDLGPPVGAE